MAEGDKVIIAIPYVKGQGRELEVAVTCWQTFCKFNYELVVIGDDPGCRVLNMGVTFIPMERAGETVGMYRPHIDMARKFYEVVLRYENECKEIVATSDDKYPVRDVYMEDCLPVMNGEHIHGDIEARPSYWTHDKAKTGRFLRYMGMPDINFTSHTPMLYEMQKLKAIIERHSLMERSYVIEDLYYNTYFQSKIQNKNVRFAVTEIAHNRFVKSNYANYKFLFNTPPGYSEELMDIILNICKNACVCIGS